MDCDDGFEYDQGDLTYVINGIDYPIPSHHWNERNVDDDNADGGVCYTKMHQLNIL